jgi:hypothetical protein
MSAINAWSCANKREELAISDSAEASKKPKVKKLLGVTFTESKLLTVCIAKVLLTFFPLLCVLY